MTLRTERPAKEVSAWAGFHADLLHTQIRREAQQLARGSQAACGYHLIGELQKDAVYYRCLKSTCKKVGLREEGFRDALTHELEKIELSDQELV